MVVQRVFVAVALATLVCLVGAPALAQNRAFEVTVVKAADGKFVATSSRGGELTLSPVRDAKITRDGKECKLEDLKKGDKAKVTLDPTSTRTELKYKEITASSK